MNNLHHHAAAPAATRATLVTLAVTAAIVGAAAPAAAQGFDIQHLQPMPGQSVHFFGQPSARPTNGSFFEVNYLLNYSNDSLIVDSADGDRLGSLVADQVTHHLMLSVSPDTWVDIGLDVPLIGYQSGEQIAGLDGFDGAHAGFAPGDIRLVPRFVLYTQETKESHKGFSLALLANVWIPVGDPKDFQGEGFRLQPRVAADYAFGSGLRLSGNLGYTIRETATINNLTVDDTFNAGVAASIPVGGDVYIVPEVSLDASVLGDSIDSEEVPTEAILGVKYLGFDTISLEAGAGTGLVPGFGVPDYRIIAGIGYRPLPPNPDPDKDGILGEADKCPLDPEDIDNFEDDDGCPDNDNDKDGIADADDRCPMDPEDMDNFEDEDGCPDLDNDNDSILDDADKCPLDPEDKDNFEDEDGCPDLDNDNDSILDADDKCPDNAEDRDGWEDEDGCPDPDNDFDGILDGADKCPNDAEVFNGVDDEDGCPDEGGLVTVDCEKINISDTIYFDTGKATIKKKSFALLNAVASVIKSQDRIKKVSIEGHTDDVGDDKSNQTLSQKRAESVREYLVTGGVAAERLAAVGWGEEKAAIAIAGLKGKKLTDARSSNRRVEFLITDIGPCQNAPKKKVKTLGEATGAQPEKKVKTLGEATGE